VAKRTYHRSMIPERLLDGHAPDRPRRGPAGSTSLNARPPPARFARCPSTSRARSSRRAISRAR
jgi:hypothetical protein